MRRPHRFLYFCNDDKNVFCTCRVIGFGLQLEVAGHNPLRSP